MKKSSPKPRKQKKPRKRSQQPQYHKAAGHVTADVVWSGIKRAQPGHRERTLGEMWDRSERTHDFWAPEYTPAEVMAGKND